MFTADQAPFLAAHACVCSPPHLRRAAARPGLPAGIYWLALCPAAGRLVRSVLTTSVPQRHLWTINSDTKAVGTTAEPTHAANWCFSLSPRKGKRLKHHWQWGFTMPFTDGVICRARAPRRVKPRTQVHELTRHTNCKGTINNRSCYRRKTPITSHVCQGTAKQVNIKIALVSATVYLCTNRFRNTLVWLPSVIVYFIHINARCSSVFLVVMATTFCINPVSPRRQYRRIWEFLTWIVYWI